MAKKKKKSSICLLFTLHASHQTTNYPKTIKSVLTQTHIKILKKHKHQTQNLRIISPFGSVPVKKARKARNAGIVAHSVDLSTPDFF